MLHVKTADDTLLHSCCKEFMQIVRTPAAHQGTAKTPSAEAQGDSHAGPAKSRQILCCSGQGSTVSPIHTNPFTGKPRQQYTGGVLRTDQAFPTTRQCTGSSLGKAWHWHHTAMQPKPHLYTETDRQNQKHSHSNACGLHILKSRSKPPSASVAKTGLTAAKMQQFTRTQPTPRAQKQWVTAMQVQPNSNTICAALARA